MICLRDLTFVLCLGVAGCAARLGHVAPTTIPDDARATPASSPSNADGRRTGTATVEQPEPTQLSAETERLLDELHQRRGLSSADVAEIRTAIGEAPPASRSMWQRLLAATVAAGNTVDEPEITARETLDRLAIALASHDSDRPPRTLPTDGRGRHLLPDSFRQEDSQTKTGASAAKEFFQVAESLDQAASQGCSVGTVPAYAQAGLEGTAYDISDAGDQVMCRKDNPASGRPNAFVYGDGAPSRFVDQAVFLEECRDRKYEGSLAAASVSVDAMGGGGVARRLTDDEPASIGEMMPATPTAGWRDHLHDTIDALRREIAAAQDDSDVIACREAQLRMLYLMADQRDQAARPIDQLAPHEQEFWGHQLHGLGLLLDREQIPTSHQRAAAAIEQLTAACDKLSESCTLRLKNLAFCREVMSYGVYREFDKEVFKPGQEVQLYFEVENFAVQAASRGYETSFEGSYHIFDATGRPVFDNTFPAASETCRNRRRDLFIRYRTWIPKQLDPGRYTLQVQIEDVKGKKFGQASREFTVAR